MASKGDQLISELYIKKVNAINALDFETAQRLNQEIETQRTVMAAEQVDDVRHWAVAEAKRVMNDYRKRLADYAEEKRRCDARLYSRFQVMFEETRDDHIHQLMDLEKEHGLTLLEESELDVPEQVEVLEKAKEEALKGNLERAMELKQQARGIGEEAIEKRRLEVEEQFKELKEEIIERQKQELEEIGALHQKELDELTKENQQIEERMRLDLLERMNSVRNTAKVKFETTGASDEAKEQALRGVNAEIDEIMKRAEEPVTVKLTKTEQMRLTTLCPTKSADNGVVTEMTERVIERGIMSAKGSRWSSRPIREKRPNTARSSTK